MQFQYQVENTFVGSVCFLYGGSFKWIVWTLNPCPDFSYRQRLLAFLFFQHLLVCVWSNNEEAEINWGNYNCFHYFVLCGGGGGGHNRMQYNFCKCILSHTQHLIEYWSHNLKFAYRDVCSDFTKPNNRDTYCIMYICVSLSITCY